jgi:hypothetical protein
VKEAIEFLVVHRRAFGCGTSLSRRSPVCMCKGEGGCEAQCNDDGEGYGSSHGPASYNAVMATLAATDLRPRRLVIEHPALTIEGRALEGLQLGGWVYGPELGTARPC